MRSTTKTAIPLQSSINALRSSRLMRAALSVGSSSGVTDTCPQGMRLCRFAHGPAWRQIRPPAENTPPSALLRFVLTALASMMAPTLADAALARLAAREAVEM